MGLFLSIRKSIKIVLQSTLSTKDRIVIFSEKPQDLRIDAPKHFNILREDVLLEDDNDNKGNSEKSNRSRPIRGR